MPVLKVDDLKQYDFARVYQWSVNFPSYSGKFFPAISVTDPWAEIQNDSMDFGPYQMYFPVKAGRGSTLTISTMEVDEYELYDWLKDWRKSIQLDDFRIALLGDENVVRPVVIERFNVTGEPVKISKYYVIPDGEVTAPYSSAKSGQLTIDISFKILGYED